MGACERSRGTHRPALLTRWLSRCFVVVCCCWHSHCYHYLSLSLLPLLSVCLVYIYTNILYIVCRYHDWGGGEGVQGPDDDGRVASARSRAYSI